MQAAQAEAAAAAQDRVEAAAGKEEAANAKLQEARAAAEKEPPQRGGCCGKHDAALAGKEGKAVHPAEKAAQAPDP